MKKYCENCKKATEHEASSKVSHLGHGVMTLLTGVWAVIWILAYVTADKSHECLSCGCTKG